MPSGTFDVVVEQLGIQIDPGLLDLAFTHRSWAYENGNVPTNERLEFLGDAVLGVVITEYLYLTYPGSPEGQLAKVRAQVVSAASLAKVARGLSIGSLIKLGRGETSTGGADKTSILADTMEAVIGAIYISGGIEQAGRFIHHLFDSLVTKATHMGAGLDWKTSLQEIVAVLNAGTVSYRIEQSGPDHDKHFLAWAVIGSESFGPGEGHNKKQAEQVAAKAAFSVLEQRAGAQ